MRRAIPLIGAAVAALLASSFPQGGLHDRYYNGRFFVPSGTGFVARDYYGTNPKPDWAYAPTTDELLAFMTGALVLGYDGQHWFALGDSATGALLSATGGTLPDALGRLYLLRAD